MIRQHKSSPSMLRSALIALAVVLAVGAPGRVLAGPAGEDDARYGMDASKKGKLREALGYFKRAIQAGGLKGHRLAAVYVNRGLTYHRMAKYTKALADYRTALKITPRNAYAYNNRGLTYEKLGRRALAIRDYRAALKIDPTLWRTKINLERLGGRP
jgi:tetratricopeptide (TPR) repeat protein